MKLTTETIKSMIDMYPAYMSAERIFVDMVGRIAMNYPQVLPELATTIGAVFNTQFETQAHAFHLIQERASYLESYLSGRMYPEEVAKKPEYIDIQRGHATKIKEVSAKAMGEANES